MANCLTVEDPPQVAAEVFDALSPAGGFSHKVRRQRSINCSEAQFAGALKNVLDEGKRGPKQRPHKTCRLVLETQIRILKNYLGARTINMRRPSRLIACSTLATSDVNSAIRSRTAAPSSV